MTLDSQRRCFEGGPTDGTARCWGRAWGCGCRLTVARGDVGLFLARFLTKYSRLYLLSRIDVPSSSYSPLLPNTCRHVMYKEIKSCLISLFRKFDTIHSPNSICAVGFSRVFYPVECEPSPGGSA